MTKRFCDCCGVEVKKAGVSGELLINERPQTLSPVTYQQRGVMNGDLNNIIPNSRPPDICKDCIQALQATINIRSMQAQKCGEEK